MWRARHPKIVEGWKTLRNSAIAAVRHPGKVFGLPNKKVMFSVRDRWLVVVLPSGRKLRYFEPQVSGEGRDEVVTYLGVDTETRRWMRTSTYGGKWCENICQGGSSDFIRFGMKNLEDEHHDLVMTVHDEAVSEVPEELANLEVSTKFFTRKEDWAKDFPLAAEGFIADRFQK
jgi:DNA polymerase